MKELSIMMPDMDGYAVLAALREQPETATIPFIFLTAKTTREDIRQGMNLGADDYVTKPFRRKELLEAIATRLNKHSAMQNLQKQVEKLQQQSVEKDELIWAVSHDLRAPLANIKLIAETLKFAPNPEQQKLYLNLLENVCDQGNELITNILTWQRLETGEYQASLENISLPYWLGGILEPFEVCSREKEQIFTANIPTDLPPMLSDPVSLKRTLTELLNNACKYTLPGGQIKFQIFSSPKASDLNQETVIFTLRNEAEISPNELPRIFEKFYRVYNSDSQESGTGLGLAIVQKLVQEQLKGTIEVESSQGWTTFTVTLPLNC
jgi:two-component system, sensor histidine kinase and response regulator